MCGVALQRCRRAIRRQFWGTTLGDLMRDPHLCRKPYRRKHFVHQCPLGRRTTCWRAIGLCGKCSEACMCRWCIPLEEAPYMMNQRSSSLRLHETHRRPIPIAKHIARWQPNASLNEKVHLELCASRVAQREAWWQGAALAAGLRIVRTVSPHWPLPSELEPGRRPMRPTGPLRFSSSTRRPRRLGDYEYSV